MRSAHPQVAGACCNAEPARDQERAAGCLVTLWRLAGWVVALLCAAAWIWFLATAPGCSSSSAAVAVDPLADVAIVWSVAAGAPASTEGRAQVEGDLRYYAGAFATDSGWAPRVSELTVVYGVTSLPGRGGETGRAYWPSGRVEVVASDPAILYHELGHLWLAERSGDASQPDAGDPDHKDERWPEWGRRQEQHEAARSWGL